MVLPPTTVSQFVAVCSPGDAPRTITSVILAESGNDPLAIHDNTTGRSYAPTTRGDAEHIASELIERQHHSVDVGLMQVNSANFTTLRLSIPDALSPCQSIRAGATILHEGYRQALRVAFSRYNTGSSEAGFANGYVARVEAASLRLPDVGPSGVIPGEVTLVRTSQILNPVVVDMLHGNELPAQSSGEVTNLLTALPSETARELRPASAAPRERISAADTGQAVD